MAQFEFLKIGSDTQGLTVEKLVHMASVEQRAEMPLQGSGIITVRSMETDANAERFPQRGKAIGAGYYKGRGESHAYNVTVKNNEVTVSPDDELSFSAKIDDRDIAKDSISESGATYLASELSFKQMEIKERRGMTILYKASLAAAVSQVHQGGLARALDADTVAAAIPANATGAATLKTEIRTLIRQWTQRGVRFNSPIRAFVSPYIEEVMKYDTQSFSSDYVRPAWMGYNDSLASQVKMFEGLWIVPTNYMPNATIAAGVPDFDGATDLSRYAVNATPGSGVSTTDGEPIIIFVTNAGRSHGPVVEVKDKIAPYQQIYPDNDTDEIKMKVKEKYGLGYVDPWRVSSIYVKSAS